MTNRPLRFCMITTFYPPYNFGGDGIFVRRLSNELARRGHRVDVIHCIDSYRLLAHREPATGYDDHPNVTVHGLRSPFGSLSPLATQQTGLPLFKSARIRQILEKGFDVIHFHNISLVGGPGILAYGKGIKLYTMHEYWLVSPTHVLYRFNREACVRPHCLACSLAYRRPPQWWRYVGLLDRAIKHVDTFIAPSQFASDRHREMGFDAPIVHLPYFLPTAEEAQPMSLDGMEARGLPYFLFVGRLEKLKGLQTLIPVFRRHRTAQLWIAGSGSYEQHLRKLATGHGNIQFLGHFSPQQLQALYQQAVAVIVPSLCLEVSPLVILEAFREKTPVIVRGVGGMPEMVGKSGGGFVYQTEEQLVAAMDRLLSDASLQREFGLRGYEAYRQNWTPEAHLTKYLALVGELAAGRGLSLN